MSWRFVGPRSDERPLTFIISRLSDGRCSFSGDSAHFAVSTGIDEKQRSWRARPWKSTSNTGWMTLFRPTSRISFTTATGCDSPDYELGDEIIISRCIYLLFRSQHSLVRLAEGMIGERRLTRTNRRSDRWGSLNHLASTARRLQGPYTPSGSARVQGVFFARACLNSKDCRPYLQ